MATEPLRYPAATGQTVTQGDADYCTAHGHAVWLIDGVEQDCCPRCGEVTDPDPAELNPYGYVNTYTSEWAPVPDAGSSPDDWEAMTADDYATTFGSIAAQCVARRAARLPLDVPLRLAATDVPATTTGGVVSGDHFHRYGLPRLFRLSPVDLWHAPGVYEPTAGAYQVYLPELGWTAVFSIDRNGALQRFNGYRIENPAAALVSAVSGRRLA